MAIDRPRGVVPRIAASVGSGAYWIGALSFAESLWAREASGSAALVLAVAVLVYAAIARIFGEVAAGDSRSLTPGERAEARRAFGDAIDLDPVRIHRGRYVFFQPRGTAMAPDGSIYFPGAVYLDDFSRNLGDAAWLVHELTHVWQHQQGMWVRVRAVLNRRYDYGSLADRRPLTGYGVEQQASIVADFYRLLRGGRPDKGSGAIEDYRAVIPFAAAS